MEECVGTRHMSFFPLKWCKELFSHSPLALQAVSYVMSHLNNNCQKKKHFGFPDVWYSSMSIVSYVQMLLIVLIALLHQHSNGCSKVQHENAVWGQVLICMRYRVLCFASFITSELMNFGVYCTCLLSPCLRMWRCMWG
jgi:hypothetical protein